MTRTRRLFWKVDLKGLDPTSAKEIEETLYIEAESAGGAAAACSDEMVNPKRLAVVGLWE